MPPTPILTLGGGAFVEASPLLVMTAPAWVVPVATTGVAITSVGWAGYELHQNWEGLGDALTYYSKPEGWQQTYQLFRDTTLVSDSVRRIIDNTQLPNPIPPLPPEPPSPNLEPFIITGGAVAATGLGIAHYYNSDESDDFTFPNPDLHLQLTKIAEQICEENGLDSNDADDWAACWELAQQYYLNPNVSHMITTESAADSVVVMNSATRGTITANAAYCITNIWHDRDENVKRDLRADLFRKLGRLDDASVEKVRYLFDNLSNNKSKIALLNFVAGYTDVQYTREEKTFFLDFATKHLTKFHDISTFIIELSSNNNKGHLLELRVANEFAKIPGVEIEAINQLHHAQRNVYTDIDIVLKVTGGDQNPSTINVSVKSSPNSSGNVRQFNDKFERQINVAQSSVVGLIVVYKDPISRYSMRDHKTIACLAAHDRYAVSYTHLWQIQYLTADQILELGARYNQACK